MGLHFFIQGAARFFSADLEKRELKLSQPNDSARRSLVSFVFGHFKQDESD